MSETPIEWAHPPGFKGETWNPTLGCDKVSPGCKKCYAIRSVNRMAGNPNAKIAAANAGLVVMTGAGLNWTGKINLLHDRLLIPLKRKTPTCYFVNSLSDLFHEDIPDDFIDQVFAVMALCPHHRFMILTKRAERMCKYLSMPDQRYRLSIIASTVGRDYYQGKDASKWHYHQWQDPAMEWPIENVWLGVSCENQSTADGRIPLLLKTPAAIRFVSYEPALGPVNFAPWVVGHEDHGVDWNRPVGQKVGACLSYTPPLDMVIAGGESGPDSRPAHPQWFRDARNQCRSNDVAYFFKQWGEFQHGSVNFGGPKDYVVLRDGRFCLEDDLQKFQDENPDAREKWPEMLPESMGKVGKKKSGALLDGVAWHQFPGEQPIIPAAEHRSDEFHDPEPET